MTLTQLEYVLAVDKHKHFGKAAESCFVTQPTLSMQLQKLEDELQITIFDRSKSPIETTYEGKIIVEHAGNIKKEQKKIFASLDMLKDEISGEYKLGVIPTLSPFILPLFIQSFVKSYPKVNLQIMELKTEEIIEKIKADEIDAGLLVTPIHEKTIIEKPLYFEPFYLFTNPKNELAKKDKISQEELDINDIWLLNKGNCFRDQILNICKHRDDLDQSGSISFESGNFETLKNMVLKSHGYTILPYMATTDLSAKLKKNIREFKRPVPTREVSLVFDRSSLKTKINDALEEEILSSIPDEVRKFNSKGQEIIEIS